MKVLHSTEGAQAKAVAVARGCGLSIQGIKSPSIWQTDVSYAAATLTLL